MEQILSEINPDQYKAVVNTEGPQLVLAGAGSGKTKVVTTKIAYLINYKKVKPWEILAFTFTNKAAAEMKERVSQIIDSNVESMWIGTFHSICVRILRSNMNLEGYTNSFTIYDTSDQRVVIRDVLRTLNLDTKSYPVNQINSVISGLKNGGISPTEYEDTTSNFREENISKIYNLYQETLKTNNALDFDDLILKTIEVLEKSKKIRDYYQEQFKYVFVDEFQDTNNPQYNLIRLLSDKYQNITVVGDADQSIYKWRGANINNILDFESDYKDGQKIILGQNYRSTQKILDAANAVINNNTSRFETKLWTDNKAGNYPKLCNFTDSVDESKYVVQKIKDLLRSNIDPSEIAILYRSNSISRSFEEELIRSGIQYKVVGGIKFYDRSEVKDLMSYLSLISNPDNDVAFKRVVNTPRRGIGEVTIERLEELSNNTGTSLFKSIDFVDESSSLGQRAKNSLKDFKDIIKNVKTQSEDSILETFDNLIIESGYVDALENEGTVEAQSKIENINEFRSSIEEYEKGTGGTLDEFLSEISLLSDVDKTDDQNLLSLMTVHSAKGLEFDHVFLVAMEKGVFPSSYADTDEDLEEERRLMYVAITRAGKDLTITHTDRRSMFGKFSPMIPSQFIDELEDNVEHFGRSTSRVSQRLSSNRKKHFGNTVNLRNYKPQMDDTRIINCKKEYEIGQTVSHRKWGNGVIVNIEELKNDKKITIQFDDEGIKDLLASFAPLEVIDE